jgi:ATP-dependent protease ClpP protease subunit
VREVRIDRALEVFGEIGPEMLGRLSQRILALRALSSEPIVLLIDSPGGDPYYADALWNLIKGPGQKGAAPVVAGVCVAQASSAAADLLCRCDHAVVYAHSRITLHGVRSRAEWFTQEVAAEAETLLRGFNEDWAQRLAPHVFSRLLDNYGRLAKEVARLRRRPVRAARGAAGRRPASSVDVLAFGVALCERVTRPTAELLTAVMDRSEYWEDLAMRAVAGGAGTLPAAVKQAIGRRPAPVREGLLRQVGALNALIASRIAADRRWRLTPDSMDELSNDFGDLLERVDFTFRDEVLDVLLEHADVFVSARDLAAITAVGRRDADAPAAARAAFEAAVERAYERILPMWSFVILLCRELQRGEKQFAPRDAFWLGLVDEIQGTRLRRARRAERAGEPSGAARDGRHLARSRRR